MTRHNNALVVFLFVILFTSGLFAGESCRDYLGASLDPIWVMSKLDEIKSGESPAERRVRDATANYGFTAVAVNNEALRFDTLYTKTVFTTDNLDQEDAGTCWIFSKLNVHRTAMVKAGKVLPEFKFSTNYVHFFDMLEKANTRLVTAILATEKYGNEKEIYRKVRVDIERIQDGGWSNYLSQLVEKYGLVPYQSMPDTYATKHSAEMIFELNRQANIVINQMILKNLELKADKNLNRSARMVELFKIKEIGMSAITKILVAHLGHPPTQVDIVSKYHVKKDSTGLTTSKTRIQKMSPIEFAKDFVQFNKDDFIVIRHYPNLPAGHYVVKRSAIGIAAADSLKHDFHFLNIGDEGTERLHELVVKSIKAGIAVEFAADVMQDNYAWYGALDEGIYDRDGVYGLSDQEKGKELTKREALMLGESSPVHAMVIAGIDLRDGEDKPPRRYLVKNTWGIYYGAKMEGGLNKAVQEGDFHMSLGWFDKNVFQLEIAKKLLSVREKKLLKSKPIIMTQKEFNEL